MQPAMRASILSRPMRITVCVPAYRRPAELERCLEALRGQTLPAHEVLVTLRPDDDATSRVVHGMSRTWAALHVVTVQRPGVVAAMNAALAMAGGDVFALTDDDAEPEADWLARSVSVLAGDATVAGVGGRDVQAGMSALRVDVGRVQWMGRVIGNHHVGSGAARDVDVLKGVCVAFRTAAIEPIGFDERLRGTGAQVHWELSLCLALRRVGWRLVYDPSIRVAHHVAPRHGADQLHRGRFDTRPHEDAVYNETIVLMDHLHGSRRAAFRAWVVLVGTAEAPGLLQLPRVMLREGRAGWTRFISAQRARRAGMRS